MDCNNPSGWSAGFAVPPESMDNSDRNSVSEALAGIGSAKNSAISIPSGLHCGPAGRRTLIKWLEDNYKLRKDMNNANPGVVACRLWQESQGFTDPISKAIIGLLKLQGIPSNVTYKVVFEKHLCKLLSMLIKRPSNSQHRLEMLAEKMISMFQVMEIQPLLSDVLDGLDDIPQFAISKLLDDTVSAHHFYRITSMNVRRKIWAASAKKLYETVSPLLERALFYLRLGILEDEMQGNPFISKCLREYKDVISEIVSMIGEPKYESSKIVYSLIMQILRVLFTQSVLHVGQNNCSSNVREDYSICFNRIAFSSLRSPKNAIFGSGSKQTDEENLIYKIYASLSVGLRYNLEESAKETVNSHKDIIYKGSGQLLFSAIRHSIVTKYQETFRIKNSEMITLEPFLNCVQLVTAVNQRSGITELPHELLKNILKRSKKDPKSQYIKIKDDNELFDVSFIFAHPVLIDRIAEYFVEFTRSESAMFLTSQSDLNQWLSLLSLGISVSYIAVCKFLLDVECRFEGDVCDCVCYFKHNLDMGKPVYLEKLLSYIFPAEKNVRVVDRVLPPFFANFLSAKPIKPSSDANLHNLGGNIDEKITFYNLLVLYLPRVDLSCLNDFKAKCTIFSSNKDLIGCNLFEEDGNLKIFKGSAPRSPENTLLECFKGFRCDSRHYIQQISSILERRNYTKEKLNFTLLYKVQSKFAFLNGTVMGSLCSTANITNSLFKMISLRIILMSLKRHATLGSVLLRKIQGTSLNDLNNGIDDLWFRLCRICFVFSDSKETENFYSFVTEALAVDPLISFLPFYPLKALSHESKRKLLKYISRNYRERLKRSDTEGPSFIVNKWIDTYKHVDNSARKL